MGKKKKVVTLREEKTYAACLSVLPGIIFSAWVILQVKARVYFMPFTQFFWTEKQDDTQNLDFFSKSKQEWIIIAGVLSLLFLVFLLITGELKNRYISKDRIYIFMGVYAFMVLLSFLLSDLKFVAWNGSFDRFEGTITIMAYLACLLFIMWNLNSEKRVRVFVGGIFVMLILIGLLGFFQSIKMDFFQTVAGQKFITPNDRMTDGSTAWQRIDELAQTGQTLYRFTFTHGEVYQTVFNINYTPFYLSAVLPLTAAVYLHSWINLMPVNKKKGIAYTAVSLFVFAISIWNFFCANSASGYFGLLLMLVLAIVIFRKKIKAYAKPLILLVLVVALVMGALTDRWWPEIKAKVFANAIPKVYAAEGPVNTKITVDEILTGEDYFKIVISGQVIFVRSSNEGSFRFTDGSDKDLQLTANAENNNALEFADESLAGLCSFTVGTGSGESYVVVMLKDASNTPFVFCFDGDGVRYLTPMQKQTAIGPVDDIGFDEFYDFGSNRGYIWARSLPMIKHTLLWGNGADTYCFKFPQHDYAGKYTFMSLNTVVDKPHSVYLGMAINTGLVSLAAWIGMLVCLIIDSIKNCLKLNGESQFIDFVGAGAFIGVCAFALVGCFNDSSVSTMPLFYSVFGLCFACNRLHKEAEN